MELEVPIIDSFSSVLIYVRRENRLRIPDTYG